MTTAKRELKLRNYVNSFSRSQHPLKKGFYLVDWGECENIQGARYALIEGENMEKAFLNLDGAIHFDDNVKLKPLNSQDAYMSMSHCYIELCDLNETKFNILNNSVRLADYEYDRIDDEDIQTEWISAKDFFLLPEHLRKKL